MKIIVNAMCGGTETKTGRDSGKPYTLTNFVDTDTMRPFSVFGDLGLPVDKSSREYVFDGASMKNFNADRVVGGKPKAPAAS